jgi:hypothetical protein
MKTNVGLIGRGKWSLKLKSKLIKNTNLKFVCGKNTNFKLVFLINFDFNFKPHLPLPINPTFVFISYLKF